RRVVVCRPPTWRIDTVIARLVPCARTPLALLGGPPSGIDRTMRRLYIYVVQGLELMRCYRSSRATGPLMKAKAKRRPEARPRVALALHACFVQGSALRHSH